MRIVQSLAKINLDLRVLYRRADGFHEIRTIFQTISLADEITIRCEAAAQSEVAINIVSERGVTVDIPVEDNLITKAARLVLTELNVTARISFDLFKRIPMGAGLGGGSSNAASILLGLPAMFGKIISAARLHELASVLGSDVPFFLYGGTAVGLGRGEELYPLPDASPFPGLLVAPAIHVSTAEAYRALSPLLPDQSPEAKRASFAQIAWTGQLAQAQNDFEQPVFALHPELAHIRQSLVGPGAVVARLTGSGSSVFGLFHDQASLNAAQQNLSAYRTAPFSLVGRAAYRSLWA